MNVEDTAVRQRSDAAKADNTPVRKSLRAPFFAGNLYRVWVLAVLLLATPQIRAERTDFPDVLAGTRPLTVRTDLAAEMVAGIDRFLDRKLSASVDQRQRFWAPDYSSPEAYVRSVADNRGRFARIIGAVDPRVQRDEGADCTTLVARTPEYTVHAVRWPVIEGVDAEGLLLEPKGEIVACIVALPDADVTPEMLAGLTGGLDEEAQYARRLAENGCRIYIPTLVDRGYEWSGNPRIRMTNQTHREWIYRMSYQVGRHIIGYEVLKVLAAVDRHAEFEARRAEQPGIPVGVMGHGEGGLIAFYAAALDPRIQAVVVSGYFDSRQEVWTEPIYRNVWALLHEFGDAEIARLIAPRKLIVEAGRGPEIAGPPRVPGRSQAAPGRLTTPCINSVREEFNRARSTYAKLGLSERVQLVEPGARRGPGTDATLVALLRGLGVERPLKPSMSPAVRTANHRHDPRPRQRRQVSQLVEHTQKILRESHHAREAFWAGLDKSSPDKWADSRRRYREYFHQDVIGACEPASLPPDPRTRKVLDEPKFTGYEVVLDVWPDVFAYGVLLIPKDLKTGEQRPVVVCQHGLEGRPETVVNPRISSASNFFGARLAERGFIVFAPQNPYIGGDAFRLLQRKANPLKLSLFSVIIRQHERILEWLAAQPFVDPNRIALYGISYGGKTAMRVPAVLDGYALSICSADFNEWNRKVASVDYPSGYMFVHEPEIFEFGLAERFNYAEMAALIAPRPFMVERGHRDGVAPDEWVAFEYAKVRRLYAELGIADRTEIEFFVGGHEIRGEGTFEFLHHHLNWPVP